MQFQVGDIFHIYNRGNNKQQIFFTERNYAFFLKKTQELISPVCDVLAYCLMPNHFHFLVQINDRSVKQKRIGAITATELTNGFRLLQSSYANAVNKENNRTGSLFQQKAKYKNLRSSIDPRHDHLECCFHYIHQNPLKAGLVNKMEDWPYSSFNEYYTGAVKICNKDAMTSSFGLSGEQFYEASYFVVPDELVNKIF